MAARVREFESEASLEWVVLPVHASVQEREWVEESAWASLEV